MPRKIIKIIKDFNAPTARNFDLSFVEANGAERITALCDELREINEPDLFAPIILNLWSAWTTLIWVHPVLLFTRWSHGPDGMKHCLWIP